MLFELEKYDRKLHRLPPAVPDLPYQPASDIQAASLLYWAEHCIECAAPSCYSTCDLYHPRADLRCRRFTFGALKNRQFRSLRGYGVEISFKKWAKMEAYGNLRLFAASKAVFAEKLIEGLSPAANVFGKCMARVTGNSRWKALTHVALEELVRRLDHQRAKSAAPDAFLLEVYNPTEKVIRMQLSFGPLPAEPHGKNSLVRLSQGFTGTLVCSPGYSRHEVDVALLRRLIESGPFLVNIIPEADSEARLVFLSAEFVKFANRVAPSERKQVKCVVLDLDNTLWKGVLVEGDEVIVRPEMVQLLRRLDECGILLSIASKNDHASAWAKLQEFGLSEYFLFPQINWNPKSQSIRNIAQRLNIGLDALAFVDDNPFELDEVARVCPDVVSVPANKIASLFSDERFHGSTTPDARQRRQLYREAEAREAVQESFGSDYLGFLSSCEMQLEISSYSEEEAGRVAELVQRTNQLNFSGRKHTRQELQEIISNPLLDKYVLKSRDRYGSYGTIGFCIVKCSADAICVQDFMLSCRLQGKLLESAFFHHLLEHYHAPSPWRLWINFQPTARNKAAQQVLETLGFRPSEAGASPFSGGMVLESCESPRCDVIQVHCSCLSQAAPQSRQYAAR